jgi:hypothetical protein
MLGSSKGMGFFRIFSVVLLWIRLMQEIRVFG